MKSKWFMLIIMGLLVIALLTGCGGGDSVTPVDDADDDSEEEVLPFWERARPESADVLERPERTTDERYTIGVLLPMLANVHFTAQAYGYFDEAEEMGVDLVFLDAGGYQYLDVQLQQGEDLINLPVDALILVAVSGDGSIPLVEQAAAANIPVINVNVMTASEKVVTRIRSDDYDIGQLQAQEMLKILGPEGNVMVIAGPAGTSWANFRSQGFIEYMEENEPGITILDTRFVDANPELAMYEAEDALTSYGDEIDAIYSGADILAVGIGQALISAGRQEDVILTTVDSTPDGIALMNQGVIRASVVQQPVLMGRYAIRAAVLALEDRYDELVKEYWVPTFIITPETVGTFDFIGLSQPPAGWSVP